MSDVQIGNTRRVIFTAMAIVILAILTFRGYAMMCDLVYETDSISYFSIAFHAGWEDFRFDAGLMVIVPLLFLCSRLRTACG